MRGLVLCMLLFLMHILNAQPLVRYNLYPFNPNFANPAATGITNCLDYECHRYAPVGSALQDAPNVQSFSVQKGISFSKTKKNGLGTNLIRDSQRPFKKPGRRASLFFSCVDRPKPAYLVELWPYRVILSNAGSMKAGFLRYSIPR